jgi:hypothetical protein
MGVMTLLVPTQIFTIVIVLIDSNPQQLHIINADSYMEKKMMKMRLIPAAFMMTLTMKMRIV